jgi:hypothetical protein
MPAWLLDSQFDALEAPTPEDNLRQHETGTGLHGRVVRHDPSRFATFWASALRHAWR